MRLSPLMIAAAAAITLAACSDKGASDAKSGPVEASASETGMPGTLADLPKPKAGLWRTTTLTDGADPEVILQCIGADEPMELPGLEPREGCVDDVRRLSNGIRMNRKCLTDGQQSNVRLSMTGDFKTRTLMELDMDINMPGVAPIKTSMRGEGVYQGPCAAGQEPGLVQDDE